MTRRDQCAFKIPKWIFSFNKRALNFKLISCSSRKKASAWSWYSLDAILGSLFTARAQSKTLTSQVLCTKLSVREMQVRNALRFKFSSSWLGEDNQWTGTARSTAVVLISVNGTKDIKNKKNTEVAYNKARSTLITSVSVWCADNRCIAWCAKQTWQNPRPRSDKRVIAVGVPWLNMAQFLRVLNRLFLTQNIRCYFYYY